MKQLAKLLPPGTNANQEISACLLLLFVELGISFGYLFEFSTALGNLYYTKGGKRYLWSDALMPTLDELLWGKLFGFAILVAGCIALAAGHYAAFYRESKSIYLMKRLEDSTELHRRCLTLPVLCLCCGILLFFTLVGLYALLYYRLTPAQCLPASQTLKLWRCIL